VRCGTGESVSRLFRAIGPSAHQPGPTGHLRLVRRRTGGDRGSLQHRLQPSARRSSVTPANRNKETIREVREVREVVMPRCPLCRSALVTITFGLYPIAICTSCSARWIQDGHQQRAINQIQEPSLMGQGPSLMAQASLLASSPTSTLTLAHRG
jgi:hypothetical protein